MSVFLWSSKLIGYWNAFIKLYFLLYLYNALGTLNIPNCILSFSTHSSSKSGFAGQDQVRNLLWEFAWIIFYIIVNYFHSPEVIPIHSPHSDDDLMAHLENVIAMKLKKPKGKSRLLF